MENIKKHKEIFIVIIVILGAIFYWFQIRPLTIKKGCSQVTRTIPADTGVTKEQADKNKKLYEQCIASNWNCDYQSGRFVLQRNSIERPPQPEEEITEEATEKEYNTCLRRHGL